MALRVGLLALQGGFEEHIHMVSRACKELGLECEVLFVKKPEDLSKVSALILPGGESTTIKKLMEKTGLTKELSKTLEAGLPAMGVCAGAILLAGRVVDGTTGKSYGTGLGCLRANVIRNYFGRQRESFEVDLKLNIPLEPERPFRAVFIRAPVFTDVGEGVKVLGELEGYPVALEQDSIIALAFHPELTGDVRLHKLFLMKAF
ncbi:MAG: pyridoxal 5'-phosphate synthase glutaminase subunit PdxT [Acidilobaceae archaeon]